MVIQRANRPRRLKVYIYLCSIYLIFFYYLSIYLSSTYLQLAPSQRPYNWFLEFFPDIFIYLFFTFYVFGSSYIFIDIKCFPLFDFFRIVFLILLIKQFLSFEGLIFGIPVSDLFVRLSLIKRMKFNGTVYLLKEKNLFLELGTHRNLS